MRKRFSLCLVVLLMMSFTVQPAAAQASGPVYIVQSGDTLFFIAARFNVTIDELIAANPTLDPNLLSEGQQIVIPGLEGVTGILETEIVSLGDSLRSLSRRMQVSEEQLRKLNRIVSPSELYVGVSVIVPLQDEEQPLSTRTSATAGESLLELAVRQNSDPWTLAAVNGLAGTWEILPGDILYSPTTGIPGNATGLPPAFLSASIQPLPIQQGGTEVIRVQTKEGVTLSGMLVDQPLHFFQSNIEKVALQGVHSLLEPGVYPLLLEATLPDGSRQAYEQMVLVTSGNYGSDPDLFVPPETIDPAVNESENQIILSIVNPSTPTRYWEGPFTAPAVYPDEFTSLFGRRRVYHGIGTELVVNGFHAGLDFAGGEGLQIFAPAPGEVVFAAPLTVRGNATIIDHGWGVYSGFWHQSEIHVNVGDRVEAGQVIGLVGGTGRVTGAHLHWEVWVNGVQVDPLDWLRETYP